jgi:hypothetical protein
MDDTLTIELCRRFLRLVNEGDPPSDLELIRALDELALAYHDTPEGNPSGSRRKPTRSDYQQRWQSLGDRFPDLGYYAISDPKETVAEEGLVGDAIDDLADISIDLGEVIWRFENLGADDAHWHFRMLYEIHWGRHLRELAFYLHAKIW